MALDNLDTGDTPGAPATPDPQSPPPVQPPQNDVSDAEWAKAVVGTSDDGPSPVERHRQTAGEWWGNLKSGLRTIGHGLTDIVGQAAQLGSDAAAEGVNLIRKAQGLAPVDAPDLAGKVDKATTAVIGKSGDDVVAHLVRTTTTFIGGGAILRSAGVAASLPKAARLAAEGGLTFGIFSDPKQGNLSSLVRDWSKTFSPGTARTVTQALTSATAIDANDSPALARAKNTLEGTGLSAVFELAFWGAKASGLLDRLGKAAEAEKPAIQKQLDAATSKVDELQANGSGPVKVVPQEDGTFALSEPMAPPPSREGFEPGATYHDDGSVTVRGFRGTEGTRHTLEPGLEGTTIASPDESVARHYATGGGRRPEGTVAPIEATLNNPLRIFNFRDHPLFDDMDLPEVIQYAKAQGHDGLLISSGHSGHPEYIIFEQEGITIPKVDPNAPRFADAADAQAQANTANEAIAASSRSADVPFTPEQMDANRVLAEQIAQAKTPKDVQRLLEGTDFNFDSMGGELRLRAQLEATSEQLRSAFDAARKTGGVTVDEMFKKAREIASAYGLDGTLVRLSGRADQLEHLYADLLVGDAAIKQMGAKLGDMYDVLRTRPDDPALRQMATDLLNKWARLSEDVASLNSSTGRGLRALQERQNPLGETIQFSEEKPATAPETGTNAPKQGTSKAATSAKPADFISPDASPEEVQAILRMFKMADGDVRLASVLKKAQRIIEDAPEGLKDKALHYSTSFFINSLISGAKTQQTIAFSGALINAYDGFAKALTGAVRADRGLVTEGGAQMFGAFSESREAVKAAAMAFQTGESVLNPPATIRAFGGVTDRVINIPGRAAGALDELNKVTAYRSIIRGKSLRMGIEEGLTGPQLAARVDEDMRLAIDPATGIAQNMKILQEAIIPTLSGKLPLGTISGDFAEFLAKHRSTKFIVPFVRPGVNAFHYVGKDTPGINLLYKGIREDLAAGGERAAKVAVRTTLAGSVMTTGFLLTFSGNVTGNGPRDPVIRHSWLRNNQPYSVKINGEWHSYRRYEPFATFIGLMADAGETIKAADDDAEAQDIVGAVGGSLISNIVNKQYMVGLSNFLDAVSGQDPAKLEKMLTSITDAAVPAAVQQFNPDPTLREAQSVIERWQARTPGLSDKLPAVYDWSGEPVNRGDGYWNRNFSVAPTKDASVTIETDLVENGIRVAAPPSNDRRAGIDYNDTSWSKDGSRPYATWMQYVKDSGIREKIRETIKSPRFQNAPPGVPGITTGTRADLVQQLVDGAQEKAFHKMLNEPRYARLKQAWQASQRLTPAAAQGGSEAAKGVKTLIDSLRTAK